MTNNDEIILTIDVELEHNGNYYARVEEAVSGSSSDTGGRTLQEVVINALEWAGVGNLNLPEDPSMNDISMAAVKKMDNEGKTLRIGLYGEIWRFPQA